MPRRYLWIFSKSYLVSLWCQYFCFLETYSSLSGWIQNGKAVTTSHKLHKITKFSDTFPEKHSNNVGEEKESKVWGKYYASLFTQMASKLFSLPLHQMRRNFGKCPNLRERLLMKRPFVWWGPICEGRSSGVGGPDLIFVMFSPHKCDK